MKDNYFEAARLQGYAIGAFNVNTYDEMVGIASAAAEWNQPVILMASMSCVRFMGIREFVSLVRMLDAAFPVSVYSHLDHCTDPDLVRQCAAAGFDSVMFDGSPRPFEENARITGELARECHERGVFLEGELGVIAGEEGPVKSRFSEFTDPDAAAEFSRRTGADLLAVSIGNAHGFYKGAPKLRFELLERIAAGCPAPLVLHGGTGIPDEDIRRAVGMGVCKVNVGTEVRSAYVKAVYRYAGENEKGDVRPFIQCLRSAVGEAAKRYLRNLSRVPA